MMVIFPEFDEDFAPAVEDFSARSADAHWSWYVRQPFSWQRYVNWWVSRRWLIPRDIRRS